MPLLVFLFLLLFGGIAYAQPTGCTTTTCTGAVLPPGYLTVSGNQFMNATSNVRAACARFLGQPGDGSMAGLRAAGFNCITIGWRDADLLAGATTFSDMFSSLLLHQLWQSGDNWGIGATFDNGIGQGGPFLGDFGSQWWVNPFNPNTTFASCGTNCYAGGVYQLDTGGAGLKLGLYNTPASMQAYINTTSQCNGTCSGAGGGLSYIGALLNNQNLDTRQFGYREIQVAVDKLAGFDFQFDIESYNGTTNLSNPPEIDTEIFTNANGVQTLRVNISGGPVLYTASSPAFGPSVSHIYGLDWQSDFVTFYVDGAQVAQVATSTLPAAYASGNPMYTFLLTGAHYRSDTNPNTGSLPVFAHVGYFKSYTKKPASSINGFTLSQVQTLVSNAASNNLGVILEHEGNEDVAPSNGCYLGMQPNGLWYDSGGIAANGDGCGNAGTVTPAQFQANWVSLASTFANNTTVIGAALHHEPAIFGATNTRATTGGGGGTGNFKVQNGNIVAPDGSVFHAFGVNIDWSADSGQAPPTVATVQAALPKLNHIRLAVGADDGGLYNAPSFSALEAYVATFTAKGIVVMIESHFTGQPSACSINLTDEFNWYNRLATDLKSNNMVMFETGNELNGQPQFGGGCLTQEHQNVYQAIRSAGNNTVIALTTSDGNDFDHFGTPNGPASAYSSMTNIVWGQHYYNQEPCGTLGTSSTTGCLNQNAVYADLARQVVLGQQYATSASGPIPTLVTEGGYIDYGNVCGGPGGAAGGPGQGTAIYQCGEGQTVQAFLTPTASNVVGGDFWIWNYTGCSSCQQTNITNTQSGGPITFYGQTVNGIINTNSPGPIVFGTGGGGVATPINVTWGGGGTNSSDALQMCSTVGTAINAANPGLVIFCPGVVNGSAQSTLLSGAAKPADCVSMQDLSAVAAHPMTGVPANKRAYTIDFNPQNVMGTGCVVSGSTLPGDLNAYFGSLVINNTAPVMVMAMGCSCDGTNGRLADDNAWGTAFTQYMNGQASGGPTFLGITQPMSGSWFAWYYPEAVGASSNPNGILQANNTTLNPGQQIFWSTLLYSITGGGGGGGGGGQVTTWNPSDLSSGVTLSNNNLTATTNTSGSQNVRSTTSKSSGKYCSAITTSTISNDLDVGFSNSTYSLTTPGGLGTDANGVGFDPNSSGSNQATFFNNVILNGMASTPSANGEVIMICADFDAQLFWATDSAMQTASGAGSWNNSNTCNPTVAGCGSSFSGMNGPYFITFNDINQAGVAVLGTLPSAMPYSLPTGFSSWDAAVTAGHGSPMIIIQGANDNWHLPVNDKVQIALTGSYR